MRYLRTAISVMVGLLVLLVGWVAPTRAYYLFAPDYYGFSAAEYENHNIGICFQESNFADNQLLEYDYNWINGIEELWGRAIKLNVINHGPCTGDIGFREVEFRWRDLLGYCGPLAEIEYDAHAPNVLIKLNQNCVTGEHDKTFYWWAAGIPNGIPDERQDLRSIIAHEFGHALGIAHSNWCETCPHPYVSNSRSDLMDVGGDIDRNGACDFEGHRVIRISLDDAHAVREVERQSGALAYAINPNYGYGYFNENGGNTICVD